jgi:hypothetical protein
VKPLITPHSSCTADQCREMGLAVGDTIEGRESYGGHWNESRLTVLFIGQEVAVFNEHEHNDLQPDWVDHGETANWTLNCREWRKVVLS